MKYYIILQPSIRSMGGEEMYTRNKIISASEQGYVPLVFHSGYPDGNIYIEELKKFEKFSFSEFRYEPCVIPEKRKAILFKRISDILVECSNDSIIESHEILVAEWGEWIASKLRIRHIAYMLLEHNTIAFKPLYDFFRFKYDRRELVGIANETIPDMFQQYATDITGYSLPAHCTNVFEDIPFREEYRIGHADFTIGSIGRTNKQYVLPMIAAITKFVKKYSHKTFNVLYVGGSMDKVSENIVIHRLSSLPNVHLIFTGMLFPIPVGVIKQMDVCLASAGSCYVSYNCGIPTISIDGNDSKAIGVLGKTTSNTLFRSKTESPIEIEDLLDDVLIKGLYPKENRLTIVKTDFSSHWKFVDEMSKHRDYFDIRKIDYPLKRKLFSLLLGYFYGLSNKSFLYKVISSLLNSLK